MNVDDYQKFTRTTAIYPCSGSRDINEFSYLALGLTGEAGEVAEKVKKRIRDGTWNREDFVKELGDVFWYLARLCDATGINCTEVLETNYVKLSLRKLNNKIGGSGDNR